MLDIPKLISKKWWFLIFNLGTTLYMVLSGNLRWDVESLLSYGVVLLAVNGLILISARRYKGRYKGW